MYRWLPARVKTIGLGGTKFEVLGGACLDQASVTSATLLLVSALLGAGPTRVTLVVGGDVIPHDPVKATARDHARANEANQSQNHDGWDHVFGPVAGVLRSADLAFVNLETPLSEGEPLHGSQMVFSAPLSMAQALAAAGVDVVSTANNHARDQNLAGVVETLSLLQQAGLAATGTGATMQEAWRPVVLERGGVRVGFLAITRWLNNIENKGPHKPYVDVVKYPTDPLKGAVGIPFALFQVKEAAAACDFLVVSVHWGEEYATAPRNDDRRFAARLLEAGAGAVVGGHPHVLQPIVRQKTKSGREGVILYSMGNLVSNQGFGFEADWRDSMLARLTLLRGDDGAVTLGPVEALPLWTENRRSKKDGKVVSNIQPVLIDDEVTAITERLAELAGRADEATEKEAKALRKRLALTKRRRALIARTIGPEFLPPAQVETKAAAVAQGAAPR